MQLTSLYLIPTILRFVLVELGISTMGTLALHVVLLLMMLALVARLKICVSAAKPISHSPTAIASAKANTTATT
jgi:hypothetical protein